MRATSICISSTLSLCFLFFFALFFIILPSSMAHSSEYHHEPRIAPGGLRDCPGTENSVKIQDLARFAVDQFNKKQNTLLEFVRVVRAQEQVVAGFLYYLTLEATDAGEKKIYEAKVVEQAWKNLTELLEFKHDDAVLFTNSDFGVKKDGPGFQSAQSVPTNDPQVQDAANHAVNIMQQRPNSQGPYELLEVTDAKAKVIDDFATFNMLLKVKQGEKEEKFKVEVQKNREGGLQLTELVQDHS